MASDSESLVKDWQGVLNQGKQMELALEKFVSTLLRLFKLLPSPPHSTGFSRTSIWRAILDRVNRERISNFTRYAARSIDSHLSNNRMYCPGSTQRQRRCRRSYSPRGITWKTYFAPRQPHRRQINDWLFRSRRKRGTQRGMFFRLRYKWLVNIHPPWLGASFVAWCTSHRRRVW